MEIRTNCGVLKTQNLSTYEPCFCARCGCRVGWIHEELTSNFIGLCDDCAAIVSQDNTEDPMY